MSVPPIAVALGDQVHAEITERANAVFRKQLADGDYWVSEDEDMIAQIGVQAGLKEALRLCAERGWLRIEERRP